MRIHHYLPLFVIGLLPLFGCQTTSGTQQLAVASHGQPQSQIKKTQFNKQSEGVWTSTLLEYTPGFTEALYSWTSDNETPFRLEMQVGFPDGFTSPWMYAGYHVQPVGEKVTEEPTFERGTLAIDHLLLKQPAQTLQFRILLEEGHSKLPKGTEMHVEVFTPNEATQQQRQNEELAKLSMADQFLDLPLRRQMSSTGEKMDDTCQTASLATALEYYGKIVPNELLFSCINDTVYDYPGVWPRVTETATRYGLRSRVTRFQTWAEVNAALEKGTVILCSIRMPEGGDYIAPPYAKIGGHIIALNGFSSDDRIVVTDSALGESGEGYRCQWKRADFEKIWFEQKGGIAMIVEAPEKAVIRRFNELPPFPDRAEVIAKVQENRAKKLAQP
ncbi:MAG: C39 family peptidase [Candidatus Sumerlaeia bacterium]|nr:C39 family peptidase [Candidatus Sumerlaeia bacterium]